MDCAQHIRRTIWVAALLSAVTLAAFWPLFHNDFIRFDDLDYITANWHVRHGLTWANVGWALRSGFAGNWHPLTWLSHMLDVQLFGVRPGWHHGVSLLLHIANSALLLLLLQRLTGSLMRSGFVAALFALHPLHVESVAWASERKDVLSGLFFMLTLLAYARYVAERGGETAEARGQRPEGRRQKTNGGPHVSRFTFHVSRYYALALVFFALGLMSKPMLVTLPFVLLLLDYWPLGRFELKIENSKLKTLLALFLEKVPFLFLSAAASIVTFLVQGQGRAISIGLPLHLRVANAVASYWKYLGKLFWPANLAIFYPHPDIRYFAPHSDAAHPASVQWPTWLIVAAALLLAGISVCIWLRRRATPWFVTGWFWYLGTLVPVIGIIQMGGQAMADRYTYIPLIGIFLCLAWGVPDLWACRRGVQPALLVGGMAALAVCATLTYCQAQYWRNDLAVFEHALKVTRDNALAHCHVGMELGVQGKYDLALGHFREALEADPCLAEAYYCRGVTLEQTGKPEEAITQYRETLKFRPFHRNARQHLAALLEKRGDINEALQQYSESLRFDPDDAEMHYLLGMALAKNGAPADAEGQFAEAIRLQPDYAQAIDRLAETLYQEGRLAEAEVEFRELVRLNPGYVEAHVNLGGILWRLGRRDEAMAQYSDALLLKPDQPVVHYDLGAAFLSHGQLDAATIQFSEAVRLKPDYNEALADLGGVLAAQGRLEEAEGQFRKLARLCPTNASCQFSLGDTLLKRGRTNEAAANFAEALRLDPAMPEKLVRAGMALAAQAQPDAAIGRFKAALQLKPEWPPALNDLAWMLATHPQPEGRNGPEAVRLAERACALSDGKAARFWNTLAAAYAETGQFTNAITTAEKARELALAAGDKEAAQAAETRLALYQRQQPYHQESQGRAN